MANNNINNINFDAGFQDLRSLPDPHRWPQGDRERAERGKTKAKRKGLGGGVGWGEASIGVEARPGGQASERG